MITVPSPSHCGQGLAESGGIALSNSESLSPLLRCHTHLLRNATYMVRMSLDQFDRGLGQPGFVKLGLLEPLAAESNSIMTCTIASGSNLSYNHRLATGFEPYDIATLWRVGESGHCATSLTHSTPMKAACG